MLLCFLQADRRPKVAVKGTEVELILEDDQRIEIFLTACWVLDWRRRESIISHAGVNKITSGPRALIE